MNHIPNKYEHLVRYYGYYSNRSRGARRLTQQNHAIQEAIRIDEPPWPNGETIPLTYHPVPDIACTDVRGSRSARSRKMNTRRMPFAGVSTTAIAASPRNARLLAIQARRLRVDEISFMTDMQCKANWKMKSEPCIMMRKLPSL